jgi:ABC-2 type transport system permease protein
LPIFRRNFSSYFSGVLGYLFIVVFVTAGAAMAFNARFFTANEPSLDQLTEWYPLLLLFFVPAITMGVWADERKVGTDELLFTLPATDIEILLGKYLSVLAVYSVALLFSMTHVIVLSVLGNPDWGLLFTTYFGYWIAGAALISAGMLASILTSSMTVAFVIGIVICCIPVFLGYLGEFTGLRDFFESLSLREQFRDFGMGVIPFTGLLYFVSFTVFMLYLNMVMMTRRHWSARRSAAMGAQYSLRSVCLALILICVTSWAGYAAIRVDATSERLFSLSSSTRTILRGLESERPIEIQAFISPDVPREYVETRKRLVGLLRQFDELGGKNLEVRYVEATEFSEQAEEAEHFGIRPVRLMTEVDGRRSEAEVFLGAVVISSYDKVVVPFFGKALPIEYELTRSVQTVANKERHTVGILTTDAGLLSGGREWQIVTELKRQYEVEEVSPATPIDAERFDVLLVGMPSSLTDPEMDNLVRYISSGKPALIFDDPFPMTFSSQFGVSNAPKQPKPRPGGQMAMFGQQQQPPPKADGGRATRLLEALDLRWEYDNVTFDTSNPHPEFEMLPAEYVFVTRDGENPDSFNSGSEITKGLQELIAIYAGAVEHRDANGTKYRPLLQTGFDSGILTWEEFVDEGGFNMFQMQPSANPKRKPLRKLDKSAHTIAAHVTSDKGKKVNAIFVSDIDMISDFFFQERSLGNLGFKFDNVTFVLNAVDALAGDESFIKLRSRRARHRTLELVEGMKRGFSEEANKAQKEADKEASDELEKRREQLGEQVKQIEENESLDPIARTQLLRQAQQAQQQRMSLAEAQIEQRKNDSIRKINADENRKVASIESRVRVMAIVFPPIPAFLVGIAVLILRWSSENKNIVASRRR